MIAEETRLREEDGTTYYRPDRYEQVTGAVNARRRQKELDAQLVEAAGKGDAASVAQCLSRGARATATNSTGFPGIHLAVASGNHDVVKRLLDAGSNVNAKENVGVTALHRAVNVGGRDIGLGDAIAKRRARTPDDEAIVKLLISSGADVNARTNDGVTPLMTVVTRRNTDVVRLLVASGADREVKVGSKTATAMAERDPDTLAALRTPEDDAADILKK